MIQRRRFLALRKNQQQLTRVESILLIIVVVNWTMGAHPLCVHVHVLHSSSFTRAAIARRQSWVHYGKRSKVSLSRAMTDFSDMWCLLYVIV